jgi:hypothetical protein
MSATQISRDNEVTNKSLTTPGCYCHTENTYWMCINGPESKMGWQNNSGFEQLVFCCMVCCLQTSGYTLCYSDLFQGIVSDCLVIPNRKHTHVAHYEGSNYISACWLQTTTPTQHPAYSIEMIAVYLKKKRTQHDCHVQHTARGPSGLGVRKSPGDIAF